MFQERRLASQASKLGKGRFWITEFSCPLGGTNDGPVCVNEFQKIKLVIFRQRFGEIEKSGRPSGTLVDRRCHVGHRIRRGNSIDPTRNLFLLRVKLALKLRHERCGLFVFISRKGSTSEGRNQERHRCHRQYNRESEHGEQLAAKVQGRSLPVFCRLSQMSARFHMPSCRVSPPCTALVVA